MSPEIRKRRGENLYEPILVRTHPELKKLLVQEAIKLDVPLNALCHQALAAFLGRPDLAAVPRGRPGRRLQAS